LRRYSADAQAGQALTGHAQPSFSPDKRKAAPAIASAAPIRRSECEFAYFFM
jgi:hypothetical protein